MSPPGDRVSIRTVISVDDSVYLHWQSQLLRHSHAKVRQSGPLTRLVATNAAESIRPIEGFETVPTRAYSPHPVSGDHYPPYNKPGSLAEWLASTPVIEDTLLLIDPDCVFMQATDVEVPVGRPIGEIISYMDPAGPDGTLVIERHCRKHKRRVQPLGIPIFIAPADLRALCPRWYELTCQIREDPPSLAAVGWTSEMWGYSIAAAELGLHHEMQSHSRVQFDDFVDRPILNYCYESTNAAKTWRWTKREYQAWSTPIPAPDDVPAAGRFLHLLLQEVAAGFQHRILS